MRSRTRAFVLVVVACLAGAGVAVAVAVLGDDGPRHAALPVTADGSKATARLPAGTRLLVRAIDPDSPRVDGQLYVVAGAGRTSPVRGAPSCVRVAVAAGSGLCLYLARTGVDYRVALLDRRLRVRKVLGLTGLPSRTRVSPDGRLGAITTFSSGHSYAAPGSFSTRTVLLDMRRGHVFADLERWRFTRDGAVVDAVDRNFWGVTFAPDGDRFYATMATGGHHYLVRGSVRAKGGEVIRDQVECPSLSPDGERIAYKRPLGGGRWRLHVLDLRSGADVALAERRSIDDQAAWAEEHVVSYSDGDSTWLVPDDGSGRPRLLVEGADSATVIDPGSLDATG